MSIRIPYQNVSSSDEAFAMVKKAITPAELAKWNVEADLYYDETSGLITAKGRGFEVIFDFTDEEVIADAKMGLLLKPFKNKILGYLENKVKKVV